MATKLKPKELYVCIESFASREHHVSRGTRFHRDHEIVERYPHFFAPADTPDDQLYELRRALRPAPPERETLGRVQLRVTSGKVMADGVVYEPDETLTAEGENARHLIDSGCVELVRKLRSTSKA